MNKIAWIRTIPEAQATGALERAYALARTPAGTVDNVMKAHSLRPHTMEGHLALYRSVLHNEDNVLPLWFLEIVASFTSMLNDCRYALTHHFTNARRLLDDDARADTIYRALEQDRPELAFSGKELALLRYTRKLTLEVGGIVAADLESARSAGADDGEILEVNQVCAYFNYSNRLLNGLGVTMDGDTVGYYQGQT
jgi:uncharacterized peroxidase-related enzyme